MHVCVGGHMRTRVRTRVRAWEGAHVRVCRLCASACRRTCACGRACVGARARVVAGACEGAHVSACA